LAMATTLSKKKKTKEGLMMERKYTRPKPDNMTNNQTSYYI
jgi:hypothetical protein